MHVHGMMYAQLVQCTVYASTSYAAQVEGHGPGCDGALCDCGFWSKRCLADLSGHGPTVWVNVAKHIPEDRAAAGCGNSWLASFL